MSFSVLIIGYKRKNFILNAVNSVLKQNYPKSLIEIVVIKAFEDSSIDLYLVQNNVINLFCDTVSNGKTISMGIRNCSKDIICFLDDDDIFSPDKFSILSQLFTNEFMDADLVINGYHKIDSKGNRISHGRSGPSSLLNNNNLINAIVDTSHLDSNEWVRREIYFNTSRMSIRRRNANSLADYIQDIPYACDSAIAIYFLIKGLKIGYTNSQVTGYRINVSSISQFKNYKKDMAGLIVPIQKEIQSYNKLLLFTEGKDKLFESHLKLLLEFLNLRLAYTNGSRAIIGRQTISLLKNYLTYNHRINYGLYKRLNLYIFRDVCFLPFIILFPKTFSKFRLTNYF